MKLKLKRSAAKIAYWMLPQGVTNYLKAGKGSQIAANLNPSIEYLLKQFLTVDFIRQYQIDQLEQAYQNSPSTHCVDSILRFFNLHPEKCLLLCDSNYFRVTNPNNITVRLATIAGDYAQGKAFRLENICDELIALWPQPIAYVLKARVAYQAHGAKSEYGILEKAAATFPHDRLIILHMINSLICQNQVAKADALIAENKDIILPEISEEIARAKAHQADLQKAMATNAIDGEDEKDIYTEEFCRSMWISYYESFAIRNQYQHGDALLREEFLKLLDMVSHKTDILLDFGCMCAEPLYHAALKYPDIQVFGCDRQAFIADLNTKAWPLPNMHFRHGDIFDTITEIGKLSGRKTLVHIRTSCVVYPAFLQKFYKACAEAGIDNILMLEGGGVSRVDLKLHDFDNMDCLSIVSNHRIYAHDYKTLLAEAGYEVKNWERIGIPALWNGFHADAYLGTTYAVHAARSS